MGSLGHFKAQNVLDQAVGKQGVANKEGVGELGHGTNSLGQQSYIDRLRSNGSGHSNPNMSKQNNLDVNLLSMMECDGSGLQQFTD